MYDIPGFLCVCLDFGCFELLGKSFFETRSHYLPQSPIELTILYLCLLSVGITGACHYIRLSAKFSSSYFSIPTLFLLSYSDPNLMYVTPLSNISRVIDVNFFRVFKT
jgi:hypothetical protein